MQRVYDSRDGYLVSLFLFVSFELIQSRKLQDDVGIAHRRLGFAHSHQQNLGQRQRLALTPPALPTRFQIDNSHRGPFSRHSDHA